jgi:hypothetical protein
MELRNAFKLRFNRHHTIHQVTPSNPFLSLSSCSREGRLRERERERETETETDRQTTRSKKFFFPGHLEQASDVAFLHFLKDGPRDQREQKERGRGDKWRRNFLCR